MDVKMKKSSAFPLCALPALFPKGGGMEPMAGTKNAPMFWTRSSSGGEGGIYPG
jgi:hypothetical protein